MAIHRNLLANFLGQGWVAAMSIAFVPVYVAHLGVEAYALIGFFAVLQGWLALLDFGMSPTLNREMARATAGAHTPTSVADLLRSIEVVCFIIALLAAGTIWLASSWIARDWLDPQKLSPTTVAHAIAVMGLVIGLRFFEGIYRGALLGMERQVWFNTANAVLATIRYAGAAALVLMLPSIEAFFWFQAAMSLVTIIFFAAATHRWLPPAERRGRFSVASLRTVAAFATGLALTTLTGLLLTHADKLMLARLLSLKEFGEYMLAVALAGLFPMLIMPVATAFYPSLTRAVVAGDNEQLVRKYRTASELTALLIAPAVAICVLFPDAVILAWTGNHALASEVGPVLRFLSIGMAANGLLQVPFALQLAHGWTTLPLKLNSAAVAVLLPGEYFAVVHFGAPAAAFVWALVNVAVLPVATILMHRRLLPAERDRWAYRAVLLPLACTMALVGLVALLGSDPHASTRLDAFGILIVAGTIALAGVSICLPTVWSGVRSLYSSLRLASPSRDSR